MRRSVSSAVAIAALVAAGVGVVPVPSAGALATRTVTTTADTVNPGDGVLSLREAFALAAADGQDTVIVLAPYARYQLTSCGGADNGTLLGGDDGDLMVHGDGATIEQTCADSGVLSFDGSALGDLLHLEALTITGGDRTTNSGGLAGGVAVLHGNLLMEDTSIIGNSSTQFAGGGGLYVDNGGTATIVDSDISGNTAAHGASAMLVRGVTTIDGSSITGNTAGTGAAIFNDPAQLTITNSTIAWNRNADGTAAAILGYGPVDLVHVTLVGDEPAQISAGYPVTFAGSVLELTVPGSICGLTAETSATLGGNYATDTSCLLDDLSDSQGVLNAPMLRSLFRNGGRSLSFYPEEASPLLDAVPFADPQLPAVDQRGVDRPHGAGGDIGSLEVASCGSLFSDVPSVNPFCWEVGWLSGSGVTTGFANGTYRPGDEVTRQSMAAFMYRLAGAGRGPDPVCSAAAFPDVPALHQFCGEIDWLVDEGITTGFGDGTYRPLDEVSRQSMAAFMYRLAGSPRGDDPACIGAPFPDVSASHPFCGEIDWLVDEAITTGFGDGTFQPAGVVTRQSMAAFMYRLADGHIAL